MKGRKKGRNEGQVSYMISIEDKINCGSMDTQNQNGVLMEASTKSTQC